MQINKVAFIGKGGVGLLYGSMIAQALGNDAIEYVMDDARFDRHANDALTINGKPCALKSVRASEAMPADLVILTVKTTGLDQALKTMESVVGPDTLIASLCNGITSEQKIAERFGWEHTILGICQGMDAVFLNGELTFTNTGEIRFGAGAGTDPATVTAIDELYTRCGIAHTVEDDIAHRMWAKLMLNDGINQTCMAYGGTYLGGSYNMCGLKWYGSNVDNREKGLPRSILTLMLNDPDTGAPLALMSANLISSYRTAAVPAVGVRYLARKDVRTVGIIGPGVMNKTTLRSFLMERPDIETVKVKGRGRHSLESYVDYVHQNFPSIKNVQIVDTEEEAIRDSDLVSVATNENGGIETYPRVKREWVKPGALICAPSDLYADREPFIEGEWKCVTDLYPMYEDWRDEIGRFDVCGTLGNEWVDMVDYGMLPRERVVDLGDIVRGVDPGRTSEDDIYFFSIGGINTEDVSWGTTIYRKAVEMGLGQELMLWDTPALA